MPPSFILINDDTASNMGSMAHGTVKSFAVE